jgi:signal transduction histidine kinase
MKNLINILFVLLLSYQAHSQKSVQLTERLAQTKADTQRVNRLVDLGKYLFFEGKDSLAKKHLDEAVILSQKLNYKEGEIAARLQWIRVEQSQRKDFETGKKIKALWKLTQKPQDVAMTNLRAVAVLFPYPEEKKSIDSLFEATEILLQKYPNDAIYAYFCLLKAYRTSYQNKAQALDWMLKGVKTLPKNADVVIVRDMYANWGNYYLQTFKIKEAEDAFRKTSVMADILHDVRVMAFTAELQGKLYFDLKDYPKALQFYQKSLTIAEQNKLRYWVDYGRVAKAYLGLKNYDKALEYAQKHLAYAKTLSAKPEFDINNQIVIGEVFLAKKQYQKVVDLATEGIKNWDESLQDWEAITEFNRQLATAYEGLGNIQMALKYFKAYKTSGDSLLNQSVKEKATVATMNFEFEQKEKGNELIISNLENEKLTQTRNFLVIALLLGLGLVGYILWSNVQLRKKNREIEAALLRGQTIERKRMASELHDNIAGKIIGLKLRMETLLDKKLSSQKQEEILTSTIGYVDDVYTDVRLISHNLLPEELERDGLQIATERLVKKVNSIGKTQFELESSLTEAKLSPYFEYEIYSTLLELVNNILKHAKASQAWIKLRIENQRLSLSVGDNGKMNNSDLSKGFGLKNIENRVRELGGKVDFLLNNGMNVRIDLPMR